MIFPAYANTANDDALLLCFPPARADTDGIEWCDTLNINSSKRDIKDNTLEREFVDQVAPFRRS